MRRGVQYVVIGGVLLAALLWGLRTLDHTPKGRARLPHLPTLPAAPGEHPDAARPVRDEDPDLATITCRVTNHPRGRLEAIPLVDGALDVEGSASAEPHGDEVVLRLMPGTWFVRWSLAVDKTADGEDLYATWPVGPVELAAGEARTCQLDGEGFLVDGIVVDLDGSPVEGVQVIGCGILGPSATDGTFSGTIPVFLLDPTDGTCTLRARWRDGFFTRSSDAVTITAFDVPHPLRLVLDTRPIAGLGIGIAPGPDGIRVTLVYPDSPADEAGVEPGDLIVAVDGTATAGMAVEDFVPLGTGAEGSVARVELTTPDGDRLDLRIRRQRLAPEPEVGTP